jgi:hypothetical protein
LSLLIGEYFQQISDWLAPHLAPASLLSIDLQMEGRGPTLGYFRLKLVWVDGSELHAREFVDTDPQPTRLSYAYHYQTAGQQLIFRYDNARHKPDLGFTDHRHADDGTITQVTAVPDLEQIIAEVINIIPTHRQP